VLTDAGHAGYGAGHVVCWFLQTRGVTEVSHVEPCALQLVHVAPPEPHAMFVNPGTQPFVGSQQPGHVDGVHGGGGGSHRPPRQTSPSALQLVHASPPAPHCVSVGFVTHTLPAQHPVQFCGPQPDFVHWPFWQTSPCEAQLLQNDPNRPHEKSLFPTVHAVPAQQPGQFCGPQSGGGTISHWPPTPGPTGTHCWPGPLHGVHCCPFRPHAAGLSPATHTFPWQHPWQFCGPHVVVPAQKPPLVPGSGTHCSPVTAQFEQNRPPTPHAV
jgi:hypothetical protein